MQIHEITKAQLTEAGILKTIGQDIKSAVTEPFQKLRTIAQTPGAWTSASTAAGAIDRAEREKITQQQAQELDQQTRQRARDLAQQWTQIVKSRPVKEQTNPGAPTSTELAKFQQRLAAASAPAPRGFAGLPGEKPQAGQAVNPSVTALPKKMQQDKDILTGNRAREFQTWANRQLSDTVSGTNIKIDLNTVLKNSQESRALKQALINVIRSNNDPAVVEQYFVLAMQAMQRLGARLQQTQQTKSALPAAGTTVSRVITDQQAQQLKNLAQNPALAQQIKSELGLR